MTLPAAQLPLAGVEAYARLVREMSARYGVPAEVVRAFLKGAGATRPSDVTGEHARAVAQAMADEDAQLTRAIGDPPFRRMGR